MSMDELKEIKERLEKLEKDTDKEYNKMYGDKSPYVGEDEDGTIH